MEIQEQEKQPSKKEQKVKGIKSMRAGRTSGTPDFNCNNCGCKRYSPCGCIKATTKGENNV